ETPPTLPTWQHCARLIAGFCAGHHAHGRSHSHGKSAVTAVIAAVHRVWSAVPLFWPHIKKRFQGGSCKTMITGNLMHLSPAPLASILATFLPIKFHCFFKTTPCHIC